MTEPGLRARKKAETRARIAATAARLFAERGYDAVMVVDVARAADVAEKTVYNYFPTKERLVLDQDESERDRLVALLHDRPAGLAPAAALRPHTLDLVTSIASVPDDQVKGVIGYLAVLHPAIRSSALAMTDRHAQAMADELTRHRAGATMRARIRAHAVTLAWIYFVILDESGRRLVAGDSPATTARALRPIVAALLDDAERAWAQLSPDRVSP